MIPTEAQLTAMIRELVADGVTDNNEVWSALVERFGGWQRLDFRLRVMQRERLDVLLEELLSDAN